MKKLLEILLSGLIAFCVIPLNEINASETNTISEEIQEKLNSYITFPNDIDKWESMDEEEVVVYIDGYKITRGDYIKLNDYAYKVDANKITEDDYIENNTRAVTSSYVNLGYNSVGAAYKTAVMYYTTSYGSSYSQTVVREYVTSKLITNWLNANPTSVDVKVFAYEIFYEIAKGLLQGTVKTVAEVAFSSIQKYQDVAMRNAFRTYAAGGNGGYFDKIENVNGNTYGYGSWNQVSIEIRSGTLNGQTVSTMYAKSTVG